MFQAFPMAVSAYLKGLLSVSENANCTAIARIQKGTSLVKRRFILCCSSFVKRRSFPVPKPATIGNIINDMGGLESFQLKFAITAP